MSTAVDNPRKPYAHPKYKGITVHPLVGGSESYSVRVYLGNDPETGKPRTKSRSFRGANALQAARAFKAERDRLKIVARTTVDLDRGHETFSSVIQVYWDDAALRLEEDTLKAHRSHIQAYIEPMLGHLRLREVTPAVVYDFRVRLQSMTGPSAVQRIMSVLSGILRSAVERGRIDANPVGEITVPKAKRARLVRSMTWDQVETIRRWFLDRGYTRGALYISILSQTGARPAEGRRIESDQVLWEHGSIDLIPPQAGRQQRRRSKPSTNKADGGRSVPLLVALRSDLQAAGVQRMRRGQQIVEGETGRPMTKSMYRNWREDLWNVAMRELGFEFRIYDLRHTFASYMIYTHTYTDVELARMLGHDVRTLHSTYAHIIREASGRGPIDIDLEIRLARDAHGTHPAGVELPPLVTSRVEITALDRFNDPDRLELVLARAGLTDIQITATEVASHA
jgi:integrase